MPKRKQNYRESLDGCEHKVDQTFKDEQKRARSIYQPRRLGLRPRRDRKEHEKIGGAATLRQRSNSKNKRTNSKKLKEETKRSKEEIKYDHYSSSLASSTVDDKKIVRLTTASTNNSQKSSANSTITPRHYWLLKAEPESRLERGKDIKFSIDDLAARTEPEPWDGIRNYGARNNLRAMKKGDLAFFYHSSCKVPAIVGIMEIVREHTPDYSAHDPEEPYYDPKDNPLDPKWSVVHVELRHKLQFPITLQQLKLWSSQKDHVLANMQMLKLARMSVTKIEEEEWNFLINEMVKRGDNIP